MNIGSPCFQNNYSTSCPVNIERLVTENVKIRDLTMNNNCSSNNGLVSVVVKGDMSNL